ncbi:protein containg FOG: GAF domain [Longilinea arvoryzae]|uniref:Protein containg FOG: GAF domain n=1 Tax=Longilinea arvoryzae TaxID=360412 RepID=A0A0S7BLP4_9CHLR|nr:GAF domain-containing protein [Longilinea arvoryzae]GAP14907.1 protein containg FOG: GAF domain [Longilinea arvoryzae]
MTDPIPEANIHPLHPQNEDKDNLRLGVFQPLSNVLAIVGTVSLIYNLAILMPKGDWLSVAVYSILFLSMITATFGSFFPYSLRVTLVGGAIFLLGAFTFILYGLNKNGVVFLLGFVFINAVLLDRRAGIVSLIVNAALIVFTGFGYHLGFLAGFTNPLTLVGSISQWVNTLISTTLMGVMMVAAGSTMVNNLEKTLTHQKKLSADLELERKGLENTISERTQDLNRRASQLQTASHVARDISSFENLDDLVTDTIELIRDQFGFYHVGLFLVDEDREFAVLKAATGEAGQHMLERNHRLKIGLEGIVGYAIEKNEPRIALDVGKDATHFKNPDLPNTHSEMALPLRSSGKVIGALDVQSEKAAAFDTEDVNILDTIADQLAMAIEKVNLLTQLKNSLAEVEASFQQYTQKAWHSHLRNAKRNYAFRYHRQHIEVVDDGYVEVKAALEANQPTVTVQRKADKSVQTLVALPIKLRGEPLGVLNLRFDAGHVPQDTIDLLENTANRLALALENARLLEELQQRAERERQIGSIVSKVRSRADIDSILRTTAEELGRSLGVAEVLVQLEEQ